MTSTLRDYLRDALLILPFCLIAMFFVTYLLRKRARPQTLGLQRRGPELETPEGKLDHPIKVQFGPCCFCGKDVETTEKEPCRLTVETREGHWQAWVCHAQCFRQRLFEDSLLEPIHF